MKARWILRNPSPTGQMVGYAIVASWWPGRYYSCLTTQLDTSSDLAKLTYCIKNKGIKFQDVPYIITGYVTCVYKCDKNGTVDKREFGKPLFERKYDDEVKAKVGHEEILEKLAAGEL
jgi:hypothetical protein